MGGAIMWWAIIRVIWDAIAWLAKRKFVRLTGIVVFAVLLAMGLEATAHWLSGYKLIRDQFPPWLIDYVPEKIGGMTIDGILSAFVSATTVYYLTLLIVVVDANQSVRDAIKSGFLGDLEIPNLARAVERAMRPLRYFHGRRTRKFNVSKKSDLEKELAKPENRREHFESVALAAISGTKHNSEDFRDSIKLLNKHFGTDLKTGRFRHIVILTEDGRNIVAARNIDTIDLIASPLATSLDFIDEFLQLVEAKEVGWLQMFGFATKVLSVTGTASELFEAFARDRLDQALLRFNAAGAKDGMVVGMIELWRLVRVAREMPSEDVEDAVTATPDDQAPKAVPAAI